VHAISVQLAPLVIVYERDRRRQTSNIWPKYERRRNREVLSINILKIIEDLCGISLATAARLWAISSLIRHSLRRYPEEIPF
jgi:hypothetical protein